MKGRRLTIDEVNEKAKRFTKEMFGWELPVLFEVSVKFTSTYGMCTTELNDLDIMELKKLQIAAYFINGDYREEDVDDVIKHELMHWYTNVSENEYCGHNKKFKDNCKKFGVGYRRSQHIPKIGEKKPKKKKVKRNTSTRLKADQYHELICVKCRQVVMKSKSVKRLRDAAWAVKLPCPRCGGISVFNSHPTQGSWSFRAIEGLRVTETQKRRIEKERGVIVI